MVKIAEFKVGFLELGRKECKFIFERFENSYHGRFDPEELFGSEDLPQPLVISPSRKGEAVRISDDCEMRGRQRKYESPNRSLAFILKLQPITQQLPETREPIQTVSRSPAQKYSQASAEIADGFKLFCNIAYHHAGEEKVRNKRRDYVISCLPLLCSSLSIRTQRAMREGLAQNAHERLSGVVRLGDVLDRFAELLARNCKPRDWRCVDTFGKIVLEKCLIPITQLPRIYRMLFHS
jgi:hypothetical protein